MGTVMQYPDGQYGYTFYTGENAADDAIQSAGHEPNGYLWEGVARYLRPDLAERLDYDPEAGMFAARGSLADVEALRQTVEPLLDDGTAVAALIGRAEAAGVEFDD